MSLLCHVDCRDLAIVRGQNKDRYDATAANPTCRMHEWYRRLCSTFSRACPPSSVTLIVSNGVAKPFMRVVVLPSGMRHRILMVIVLLGHWACGSTATPTAPIAAELRGVVRSSDGAPVQGARVHVGNFETTSDIAGRFVVTTDQPHTVRRAVAIHDDYEAASVELRPEHLVTGVDLVLSPSPDRVYVRARGHNVCTERQLDLLGGRQFSTFAVLRGGPFGVVAELRDSPFDIGGGAFLYRVSPRTSIPSTHIEHSDPSLVSRDAAGLAASAKICWSAYR